MQYLLVGQPRLFKGPIIRNYKVATYTLQSSELQLARVLGVRAPKKNIGALVIRIGFWGVYYTTLIITNPPKIV